MNAKSGEDASRREPKRSPSDALSSGETVRNLKARAISGFGVTLGTQGAKLIVQLCYTAVMSRLLTSADFGLIAMVTSMMALLTVIRDGGLTTATIQRPAISHDEVTRMFWVNVALGMLLALVGAGLAPVLAWFYGEPELLHIVLLFSVTFALSGLMVQQEAIVRRNMRFNALAAIELVTLAVGSISGIASAWAGLGYWALVIGVVAGNAVNAVFLWVLCEWRPGRPAWPRGLRSTLSFGGHVMAYNLVSALGMNLDKVLLGRLHGSVDLGFYSRAQVLMVQPCMQMLAPLGAVAIPTLSRLHAEPDKFREAILRLLLVVGFASSLGAAFTFAGADWIVRILLGEGWSETAAIVRAFSMTLFSMPISVVATWALTTAGLGKELSLWGMVNNAILVAAIACGLPWGGLGVALAFSVSGILLRVPLLYCFVAQKTGIELGRIVRVVGPAFIAFALVGSCLYALFRLLEDYAAILGVLILMIGTLVAAVLAVTVSAWGKDAWGTVVGLAGWPPVRLRWPRRHPR
ncbi:MAG: lipopolysaccharide biosynthesis protein [Burkholderiales bacterium]